MDNKHTSRESAKKEAKRLSNKFVKKAFVMESDSTATPDDINIKVDSYKAALEYLKCDNSRLLETLDKHTNAIMALYKLITIAEAWNKVDSFVPDFSNRNQFKWFPWFVYSDDSGGFVYARTTYTAANAYAHFGSRLCFKSEERATQFGKQFIDLWNDFLLFK